MNLIQEHKPSIEILVIDPLLPDAFGFISRLRSRGPLKVIAAIPENWETLPPLAEVDAVLRKPHHFNAIATLPWISLIQSFPLDTGTDCSHPSKLVKR